MELKNCPFCGGEARLSYGSEVNLAFGEESYAIAMCCSCGIRTPKFYYCPEQGERCDVEMTLAKRWNRRVTDGA